MAHLVFVSLYDEYCHGMRLLTAELKAAGHQANLICFKQFRQMPVAKAHEVWDECHVLVFPDGDTINAYSYPATERELNLFVELIQKLDPDMVGFGFTATQQRVAARLTALVKDECHKPVIHGGPFPTKVPGWCLEHGADFVCQGEADDVILDIAHALDSGDEVRDITNICYRDAHGKMVCNPRRPLIMDLDRLPYPDFSENNYYLDDDILRRGSPPPDSPLNDRYIVITARGCPYMCTYCYQGEMNVLYARQKRVRERSIDHVMGELHQARSHRGHNYFLEVQDSIFTLNQKRLEQFCDVYHRELNMPFWCYTHPACAKPELLRPIAECGNCDFIVMGIESASDEIGRRMFQRAQTNELVRSAACNIHEAGMKVFYDMITNVPGETEEMCRQNLDLLRSLPKPWRLRLTKLSLFPEYQIRKKTDAARFVDSQRYKLWNALYFLVQDIDLTDEEVDALLADPVIEQHPGFLHQITGAFERRFRELDDTSSRLRVERAMHGATKHELECLHGELRDIKYRKGFRHFLRLSDAIQGWV